MNYNHSRISASGPEGNCTSCFKRVVYFMSTACGRPQGGGGFGSCGLSVKNTIFLWTS